MIIYHFGSKEEKKNRQNFNCHLLFFFSHHTYKKNEGQIELVELGPRFEMKCKIN